MLQPVPALSFSLLSNNILLYGHTAFSLSIHHYMDLWVASTLGPLWVMLLWTFEYKFLCEQDIFISTQPELLGLHTHIGYTINHIFKVHSVMTFDVSCTGEPISTVVIMNRSPPAPNFVSLFLSPFTPTLSPPVAPRQHWSHYGHMVELVFSVIFYKGNHTVHALLWIFFTQRFEIHLCCRVSIVHSNLSIHSPVDRHLCHL